MTAISPSFCKPTSVVTGSHPPRWGDSDRRSAESIFARGAGAFHSGTNSAVRKLILQFDGDARNWCICCQRKASKRKRSCGARSIKPARWTGVRHSPLETGQPAAALHEFEAALEQTPNRYRTFVGIARAANAAGDRQKASEFYGKHLAKNADTQRPETQEAKAFLAGKQ
jgi:hypothetical protein